MPSLSFILPPGQVGKLHGLLSCLLKFDENISLEASAKGLRISSLNASKSAHASFSLATNSFLVNYHFRTDAGPGLVTTREKWSCTLQNRALLSIFKRRYVDARDKDSAPERCEFELHERADETDCRLVVRLICRYGVVKTYRLTYEPANVLSANFDSNSSPNCWSTAARTLRDTAEYFGAKAEHLDWSVENGKVNFISYTEKIADGREIFKRPMQTSVAIERKEFADFNVQEDVRVGILVRDFRAIVTHADGLGMSVTARYSRGNRPLQFFYEIDGMLCEFTLMTRGRVGSASSASTTAVSPAVRPLPVRMAQSQQSLRMADGNEGQHPGPPISVDVMGPPVKIHPSEDPRKSSDSAGSAPAPSATLDQNSLFFAAGPDEAFWDEKDEATVERDDFVTWDAGGRGSELSPGKRLIRDSEPSSMPVAARRPLRRDAPNIQEIAPTQRLSQLKGLFD